MNSKINKLIPKILDFGLQSILIVIFLIFAALYFLPITNYRLGFLIACLAVYFVVGFWQFGSAVVNLLLHKITKREISSTRFNYNLTSFVFLVGFGLFLAWNSDFIKTGFLGDSGNFYIYLILAFCSSLVLSIWYLTMTLRELKILLNSPINPKKLKN